MPERGVNPNVAPASGDDGMRDCRELFFIWTPLKVANGFCAIGGFFDAPSFLVRKAAQLVEGVQRLAGGEGVRLCLAQLRKRRMLR